jgi:hypothetical protein
VAQDIIEPDTKDAGGSNNEIGPQIWESFRHNFNILIAHIDSKKTWHGAKEITNYKLFEDDKLVVP